MISERFMAMILTMLEEDDPREHQSALYHYAEAVALQEQYLRVFNIRRFILSPEAKDMLCDEMDDILLDMLSRTTGKKYAVGYL